MSTLLSHSEAERDEFDFSLVLLDREPAAYVTPPWLKVDQLDCRGSLFRSILGVRRLFRREQPDITLSFLTRANVANVCASRLRRKPAIISERVHTTTHLGRGLKGLIGRKAVQSTYPHAETVVAVSPGVAEDLEANFGVSRAKLITIENPFDIQAIRAQAAEAPAVSVEGPYVVAMGRLVRNKNFPLLIEAFKHAGAPGSLVIIGDGPDRAELEGLIERLGLTGRVVLTGFLANPFALVARASAFVLPSNAEGFPNSLVEAMALGRPVISTNCASGPSEILADLERENVRGLVEGAYGILTPPGSVEHMAAALMLLQDPAVASRYAAQSTIRAEEFDVDRAKVRYWDLIRKVASGEASRTKVCVTGLRGIPRVMGGVETHCEALYPRLKTLLPMTDFEVLGRKPYLPKEPFDYLGVRVTPLLALRSKYLEAISHTFISLFYARFVAKAHVVHIHAIGPGVLAPLAVALGLKVVVTHHGQDFRREKWNRLAKGVLQLGEQLSAATAQRVIVVGLTLSRQLKRRYPNKIEYIPNGMSETAPAPVVEGRRNPVTRLTLTPGGYILGVGRIVPEKRFEDLIDAVEGLAGDHKLVIVGGADHEDAYSRQLLERASDRVIFAGALQNNELGDLYKNCSVFVLPSTHEGLSITVLEAISGGAPVILSDISQNIDIGLPAQNYFPVGDVTALRDRLQEPYGTFKVDPALVAGRFDWEQIALQTAGLYRDFGCR